ncbi:MAG: hypothetical protein ACI9VO_002324, partial [Colwellia sp.]
MLVNAINGIGQLIADYLLAILVTSLSIRADKLSTLLAT